MFLRPRVIPILLLKGQGLVKTTAFKDPVYLGDPINAVKIFNEREVDELIVLDISVGPEGREPQFQKIEELANECFMPLCYGGGVRSFAHAEKLFQIGIEKVALNSVLESDCKLISQIAATYGNQSVVVSLDVKKSFWGKYEVCIHSGRTSLKVDPIEFACKMEDLGAGEILLTSIERDGTMKGYDLDLVESVAAAVKIPVIACGGAGSVGDFAQAIQKGRASAVAAGSLFVFHGKHKAVLINYPDGKTLEETLV